MSRQEIDVSKIRRDALALPIAVARRFRSLWPLNLLLHRLRVCRRGLPSRFGFGKRALRGWRQRLVSRWRVVSHDTVFLQQILYRRYLQTLGITITKLEDRFLEPILTFGIFACQSCPFFRTMA